MVKEWGVAKDLALIQRFWPSVLVSAGTLFFRVPLGAVFQGASLFQIAHLSGRYNKVGP